jgi:hypothetical protein
LHGSYEAYDDIKYLPPDKDVFLYSKSSPGSLAVHCGNEIKEKLILTGMARNIMSKMTRQPYVPFDEINLSANIEMLKVENYIQANPRIENEQFAKAMQHYISPQTQKYIEKKYERDDRFKYVIDVEEYFDSDGSMVNRLTQSNIFDRLPPFPQNPKFVTLSSIIHYYLYGKNKRNLFIYDMSCGSLFPEGDMPIEKLHQTQFGLNITDDMKPFFEERTTRMTAAMRELAHVGFGGASGSTRNPRPLHKYTRKNKPKKKHRRILRSGKTRSHA